MKAYTNTTSDLTNKKRFGSNTTSHVRIFVKIPISSIIAFSREEFNNDLHKFKVLNTPIKDFLNTMEFSKVF